MKFLIVLFVLVAQSQQDDSPYEYQTIYDTNYNSEDWTSNTQESYKFPQESYHAPSVNQEKNDVFADMDMNMVAMGAAGVSSVIAVGALAYALSLEARILALASTQSTIDTEQTAICTAVKSFTSLTRTAASGATAAGAGQMLLDGDCTGAAANTVECRNQGFLTSFVAVGAPTCS